MNIAHHCFVGITIFIYASSFARQTEGDFITAIGKNTYRRLPIIHVEVKDPTDPIIITPEMMGDNGVVRVEDKKTKRRGIAIQWEESWRKWCGEGNTNPVHVQTFHQVSPDRDEWGTSAVGKHAEDSLFTIDGEITKDSISALIDFIKRDYVDLWDKDHNCILASGHFLCSLPTPAEEAVYDVEKNADQLCSGKGLGSEYELQVAYGAVEEIGASRQKYVCEDKMQKYVAFKREQDQKAALENFKWLIEQLLCSEEYAGFDSVLPELLAEVEKFGTLEQIKDCQIRVDKYKETKARREKEEKESKARREKEAQEQQKQERSKAISHFASILHGLLNNTGNCSENDLRVAFEKVTQVETSEQIKACEAWIVKYEESKQFKIWCAERYKAFNDLNYIYSALCSGSGCYSENDLLAALERLRKVELPEQIKIYERFVYDLRIRLAQNKKF